MIKLFQKIFNKNDMGQEEIIIEDPTAWMLDNSLSEFILTKTLEIKIMCMIGYTFFNGNKVFASLPASAPISQKFVLMIMACTGGGILVPIFINGIPVPLANDYYIMSILFSFAIHHYFPIIRDVYKLSGLMKLATVVLYEVLRSGVVVALLSASQKAIPATAFTIPFFGPIFCGTLAGCGGAFFPLNKGLDPIKNGLAAPMATALIGATLFHIFTGTRLSDGIIDARKKAHVHLALFFIFVGVCNAFGFGAPATATKVEVKDEEKKKK